jgi:hypothetical protein
MTRRVPDPTDSAHFALSRHPVDESLLAQVASRKREPSEPSPPKAATVTSRPLQGEIGLAEDLRRTLAQHPVAESLLARLPPSHIREYVSWIEDAKKPATRQRRIAGLIDRLLGKKR